MTIFQQASKQKLRFSSDRGELTTEQLWDLPLQSKNNFDLDSIAKAVHKKLKETAEESFVSTKTNPANSTLTLQLDILKQIISVKIAEADAAKQLASKSAERQRLRALLDEKNDDALKNLTVEEIQKRLAELDA